MHSLWTLEYSHKFEMEAWRVACTGWCQEVCTNCRHGEHCQCARRCYYHKCYFKRRDEKGNTWLWAPGLCSRALPGQCLLQSSSDSLAGLGVRGSQGSVQTRSSALPLCPAPPTLLYPSPFPCPLTPPLKSQIPEIPQPTQERNSRALLLLLSEGQLPIWMSQVSISCCNRIFFPCPTHSSRRKHLFPSLHLPLTDLKTSLPSPWNQPSHPSWHPSHCFSPVISSWSPFSRKCSAHSLTPCSKKGFLLPHEEEGPHHVILHITFLFIHPITLGVFFRNRMLLNHAQLATGCNPRRTLLHNCCRGSLSCPILYLFSWSWLLLKSTNTHLSNPLLVLLHHMLTLLNLSSSLSIEHNCLLLSQ